MTHQPSTSYLWRYHCPTSWWNHGEIMVIPPLINTNQQALSWLRSIHKNSAGINMVDCDGPINIVTSQHIVYHYYEVLRSIRVYACWISLRYKTTVFDTIKPFKTFLLMDTKTKKLTLLYSFRWFNNIPDGKNNTQSFSRRFCWQNNPPNDWGLLAPILDGLMWWKHNTTTIPQSSPQIGGINHQKWGGFVFFQHIKTY